MQLVVSGNRILAHGEGFLAMGGTVINTDTGRAYQNATVVECDGCPSDIDKVGYEYHAGQFVPCAPFGMGDGNIAVVCGEDCKSIKDSGIPAKGYVSGDTAALFGLGEGAVPNDVFGVLSRFHRALCREHLWAKYRREIIWTETTTTIGSTYGIANFQGGVTDKYQQRTVACADDFRVYHDADGTIKYELVNPQTVTYTHAGISTLNSALANKYIIYNGLIKLHTGLSWKTVDQAGYNVANLTGGSLTKYTDFKNKDTFNGYENSPVKDAYPKDDGNVYVYLGSVGDVARIAHESATDEILNAILGVTE